MRQQSLIINIRGNSGSGKTFLTREFMKLGRLEPITDAATGKLSNYLMRSKKYGTWMILGKYENACGGVDTIKTQQEIIDRVESFSGVDGCNIWLEGLILSTIYGSVGAYSEKFGNRWVFAYLQPPIEECIRRIKARRKKAGQTKPLNETNTRNRVKTIQRNKEIVGQHGRRVIELDWKDPLPELLKLIKKEAA